MIVLEGMDNTGKTTLANKLSFPVIHPGPAPLTLVEETKCLDDQLNNSDKHLVMDRITCISQQIYQDKLFNYRYMDYLRKMQEYPNFTLVYCRPPIHRILSFDTHKVKPYDTVESLNKIRDNAIRYVELYDELMSKVKHIVYDYTKHLDEIIIPLIKDTQHG